ncbi:hypothetical protein [Acetobacter oeni]|uniref:Uncharacterized protein n=1 Tax=Acetobacter oeni TaxID=304077 RepID=A0A511XJ43_9PROT|nr:hypothetical protein [Acetobacter oeni]MBB3882675.1 hypothetical protein [Acetobacter oeni]NHO18778.1 hypothetical protein [Acetobacter oeni]GBR06985.1 hypothetical protein AA21952_2191 [Acetobacter oeni LMG 21952]GEN62931.1 hypothetical protein AOE01nite_11550 [Acetobacter oeni]
MSGFLSVAGAVASALGGQSFTLGTVIFLDTEVPSFLKWGGYQDAAIMHRPGGGKTVTLAGYYEKPLVWSGVFRGFNGLSRANLLAAMVQAGGIHDFTGAGLSRQVTITSFECVYTDNGTVIPYNISCEVIPSVTNAVNSTKSALCSLIGDDASSAVDGISDLVDTVGSYISSVSSAISTYTGEITPLVNLFGAGSQISMASATLSGIATDAGALSSVSSQSAISTVGTELTSGQSEVSSVMATSETEISSITSNAGTDVVPDSGALVASVAHSGIVASTAQVNSYISRAIGNVGISNGTIVTE